MESNGYSFIRPEDDVLIAVGEPDIFEAIAPVEGNCADPCSPGVAEFGKLRFLNNAEFRHHHHEVRIVELLHRNIRRNLFLGLLGDQVGDGFPA